MGGADARGRLLGGCSNMCASCSPRRLPCAPGSPTASPGPPEAPMATNTRERIEANRRDKTRQVGIQSTGSRDSGQPKELQVSGSVSSDHVFPGTFFVHAVVFELKLRCSYAKSCSKCCVRMQSVVFVQSPSANYVVRTAPVVFVHFLERKVLCSYARCQS